MFAHHLTRWRLTAAGEPIITHSSQLLPVCCEDGTPAMLKIAGEAEEKFGGELMVWWSGEGAARVLAHHDETLLLERAEGPESLIAMSENGRDDEATRLLCAAVARLHAPRPTAPPELIPLQRWFAGLWPAAEKHGGIFTDCARIAQSLLAAPRDSVVLHGDIHHGNILDFGPRGWLAIDPKRLHGERAFDYANLFCNPDLETAQAHFHRRLKIVSQTAGFEPRHLLQWIAAWSGLSAAWALEDGGTPEIALAIAELALDELARF